MTGAAFERLFGGPARQPESKLTQREMDLARSIQDITEEVMLKMTAFAHRETGMRDLCLAGGVALNCVGNGRILREGPFDQIWIQPAAGDAGGALGVALAPLASLPASSRASSAEALGTWERPSAGRRRERDPALRRRHERLVPRAALQRATRSRVSRRRNGYAARRFEPAELADRIAALLAAGEGRRPVPGPDGVRPARARRPLDHRRRAVAEDAVGDEPEDQVPRIVPAVRAGGAARARRASGSSSTATARTCCSSPTCSRRGGCRPSGEPSTLWGIEQLNVPRSTSRRSRTSTTRRASRPCGARRTRSTTTSSRRFTSAPAAPSSSTRRSTSAASRSSARPRTPIAASCARTWTSLVLENFVLEKSEQAPVVGRRVLAQGIRARLTPCSSGDGLRPLLRRSDSRTMIVRPRPAPSSKAGAPQNLGNRLERLALHAFHAFSHENVTDVELEP